MKPAAQHARLRRGGSVEDAGLPGRYAGLRGEQFDFAAGHEPRRRRLARRAHAHCDVEAARIEVFELSLAEPIDVALKNAARRQRFARADVDFCARRVERRDIERLGGGDAKPAPLADRVMNDALVTAEHAAVDMDDLARRRGARHDAFDHLSIAARRHEADVLAVGLLRNGETVLSRERAHLRLGQIAQREAQQGELLAGVVANRK